jgi:HlyD family secretion protein
VLVRLDATVTQANLAIVKKNLDELTARNARLEAEQGERDEISFPDDFLARAQEADVGRLIEGERRVFQLRRTSREGQKAQLRERVAQLNEEIEGLKVRESAKGEEVRLIQRELKGSRDLWQKGLLPISKLTALERDAARLEGERGQLMSAVSETKGKISETELQIVQIDHDLRTEVGKELREI